MKYSPINIIAILTIAFICSVCGFVLEFFWSITSGGMKNDSALGFFSSPESKLAFIVGFIAPLIYFFTKRDKQ